MYDMAIVYARCVRTAREFMQMFNDPLDDCYAPKLGRNQLDQENNDSFRKVRSVQHLRSKCSR